MEMFCYNAKSLLMAQWRKSSANIVLQYNFGIVIVCET